MYADILSSSAISQVAITTGIAGLLGFIFIVLFFTVGQPFGTLNDICIGLTAILSAVLLLMLYPRFQTQSPVSQVVLAIALFGAALVLVGSILAISGIKGWYLSGLYMAAGNGLIGVWLLGLSYAALQRVSLPQPLVLFGLLSGAILALGLVAVPDILRGLDPKEYTLNTVNAIWWTSSLGWLVLYPIWSIWLGRFLLVR